jgi:phage gp36-like protein
MIKYKEELLADIKNLLYHHSDDVELLAKQLKDADVQLVQYMKQIRLMDPKKVQWQKQLDEIQEAARAIVDMVDPLEEGIVDNRTLLERLREAPQMVASYVSGTTKAYVTHVLGLIKPFWPKANVEPLAEGKAADCSEEKFAEYLKDIKPVADKIVENLEQD